MADAPQDRPTRPHWRVPPHVARELAARVTAAGDDLRGIVIRINEDRDDQPMTFDVVSSVSGGAEAARVAPLNDTFKCPPRCG